MLSPTRGIVLRSIKYGETSLISKVYTEHFGLQSYIIKGTRSPKSKIKAGTLQPLTLLDMQVYRRENKNLQHVKELGLAYIFTDLPFNIAKSSVGIFMVEILLQAIKEEEANPALFSYLFNTIRELDTTTENLKTYHLRFLVNLSRLLGFYPSGQFSAEDKYFDMQEGVFTVVIPPHPMFLADESAELFSHFIQANEHGTSVPDLNNSKRKELLESLLTYYRLHISNFNTLRSVKILEDVLRG